MKKKIYTYMLEKKKKKSTAENIHIKILEVEKKRPTIAFKLGIWDLILQTLLCRDKLKPKQTLFE